MSDPIADLMANLDLVKLQETAQLATQFLQPFARSTRADWPTLANSIRPHDEDWAKVFRPDYVEMARQGYAPLWDNTIIPERHQGQTEVQLAACAPAILLQFENPVQNHFPGGYKRIAAALQPDMVWVCWRFVEPGRSSTPRVVPSRDAALRFASTITPSSSMVQ